MRAAWPENRPLAVALNVIDGVSGGLTVEDGVTMARELKDHGCDLITVMAGQTTLASVAPYRRGFLTPLADRVRNEADIPTMVGGYLLTSNEANTLLAAGRADMCLLEYSWPEDGIIPETSPSTDETLNRSDTRSTKRHTKQEARHGR